MRGYAGIIHNCMTGSSIKACDLKKWLNILKQFYSRKLQNCFSMCGHLTTLRMKGLSEMHTFEG